MTRRSMLRPPFHWPHFRHGRRCCRQNPATRRCPVLAVPLSCRIHRWERIDVSLLLRRLLRIGIHLGNHHRRIGHRSVRHCCCSEHTCQRHTRCPIDKRYITHHCLAFRGKRRHPRLPRRPRHPRHHCPQRHRFHQCLDWEMAPERTCLRHRDRSYRCPLRRQR